MKKIRKNLKKFMNIHKRQISVYSAITVLLFVLIALYMNLVKLIVFVAIIILLNIFLRFYKRAIPMLPVEFELTIFGTLLTGVVYGIWPAIFIAVFSCICADFFNQSILSPFSLISLGTYLGVAFISPFVPSSNIFITGMVIVIIANIIIFFGNIALGYHDQIKNFAYSATNIFFNYLLFKYLAEIILKVLML